MAGEIWTPWWTHYFHGGDLGCPSLGRPSSLRTVGAMVSGPLGDGDNAVMICHLGAEVVTMIVSIVCAAARGCVPCGAHNVMWLGCSWLGGVVDRGPLWEGI